MDAPSPLIPPPHPSYAPSGPDAKAAEASAAYYAPNAPHYAYAPPPPYVSTRAHFIVFKI